jgi:hypothetical protein
VQPSSEARVPLILASNIISGPVEWGVVSYRVDDNMLHLNGAALGLPSSETIAA